MEKSSGISRRNFISNTAKGSIALTIGLSGVGSFLESCNSSRKIISRGQGLGFNQRPLPYKYDALENVIDAQTMEIHYSRHAAAYSKSLNEAVKSEAPAAKDVESLLAEISKYSPKMRNNAGGHYNHEMFWQSMRPKRSDNRPSGTLLTAIENGFSSFANFKSQFSEAAKSRFGSGWAWLYSGADKTLRIGSTPNQDNPLMNVSEIKGFPLLGLDVWEHAYYLKYQNKRPAYLDAIFNVVDWEAVAKRYQDAK